MKKHKRTHIYFIDTILSPKHHINKKIMKQIKKEKMTLLTKHYYSTVKS